MMTRSLSLKHLMVLMKVLCHRCSGWRWQWRWKSIFRVQTAEPVPWRDGGICNQSSFRAAAIHQMHSDNFCQSVNLFQPLPPTQTIFTKCTSFVNHTQTILPHALWDNCTQTMLTKFSQTILANLYFLVPIVAKDKGNCAETIFTFGAQITVTTCRIVQCGANLQNMLRQCSAIFTAGRSNANYHKLFWGSKSAWGHLRENCVFSQALMERSDLIVRGKAIHLGRC